MAVIVRRTKRRSRNATKCARLTGSFDVTPLLRRVVGRNGRYDQRSTDRERESLGVMWLQSNTVCRVSMRGDVQSVAQYFRRNIVLYYALVFFVIAVIAALFGFGGIAAGAVEIAKILFFIFLVLFVVSFAIGLLRRIQ